MFIGGLGFGAKILYENVGPSVDPFDPDNIVILSTGALTGLDVIGANRMEVTTKSPLTRIVGTGNVGGFFGVRLKHAGYDAIVIRGRSEKPIYLWIDDEHSELRDGSYLWRKDCWKTTDILRSRLGNEVSVMSIGPAGENLVRFACPIFDYHHAPGRSHAGAVMGAKNLKAIVVRGSQRIDVAFPKKFEEAREEAKKRIYAHPVNNERIKVGSAVLIARSAEVGVFGIGLHVQQATCWG